MTAEQVTAITEVLGGIKDARVPRALLQACGQSLIMELCDNLASPGGCN